MQRAYVSHPDCLQHETGRDHSEILGRCGASRDRRSIAGLLDCTGRQDAPLTTDAQRATDAQLARAHSQAHVDRAVATAPTGEAPSAICSIRPPGHPAGREAAMGFCFVNDAAVGRVERDCARVAGRYMAVAERQFAGRVDSCLEGGCAPSALGRNVAAHVRVLASAD